MNARRVIAAAVALSSLAGIRSVCFADPPTTVTVAATPSTLTLCPGVGEGQVLVMVRNSGTEPIRKLCMRSFRNGPLKLLPASGGTATPSSATAACPEGTAADVVPPGGVFSQIVAVALTDYPASAASAYFWAKYQAGTGETGGSETTVGTVEVKAPLPPSADALKLEAKAGFASLHEREVGRVVLTITNGTNEKFVLNQAVPSNPVDTSVTIASAVPSAIAPQSTVAVDLKIEAGKEIHPGKYIGLIDVDATTSCGIAIHRVASYEVTLGVFGESTLLTLIGVPSLLFLPGFLILTTWMLLWRFKWLRVSFLAKSGSDEFFVGARDPEFWLLGITISLVMFGVAPKVTQLGYRRAYALADIATLWCTSLGIGIGVYVLFRVIDGAVRRIVQARKVARTFTENDDVLRALGRMKLRGWTRDRIRPVRSRTDAQLHGFRLWSDDDGGSFWVIPQIVCRSEESIPSAIDPGAPGIEIAELARRLEILEDGRTRVEWAAQGPEVGKPRQWKRDDFQDAQTGELVKFSPQ